MSEAFAYFEPEFMALDAEKLTAFKTEEPGLGLYDHYFERLLANKDHVLSQEAEDSWQQPVIFSTVQRIPLMSWIMLISSSHGYQMAKGMWLS